MVSVNHHYLPQYYLKGFTDDKNGYWVYDKQADKIFRTGSVATFYEKNGNTITSSTGTPTDFLETFYTDMENQSWQSLDAIRASTHQSSINLEDMMNLYLFLLFLHWRLPSNFAFVEKLSESALDENNEILNFFNVRSRSGKAIPEETIQAIRASAGFKKSMKAFLPFVPFFKNKDWNKSLENWRFLYSGDDARWNIIGDNPLITEGIYDHDPINCLREFIFPISGRILLVNTDPPIHKGFPPEITIFYGTAIIERARRFVACHHKEFLEALVAMYKNDVQAGMTHLIVPVFFNMLKR